MKRDLAKTFQHMSIIEIDWWLLSFFWENDYYYDRFLLFDLHIFFYIFDLLIKALHWILLIVFHWIIILHYLDDFFAILLSRVDSILYQKHIDDLCIELELKINHKKNICDTIVDFLDIELDNELMKARLFKKKLERAIHEIKSTLKQSSLLHIELQSLVDFLSFVVKMMISSRTFLRRLYDAFRTKAHRHHIIAIMRFNFQWWNHFLFKWNDIKSLSKHRSTIYMWIDAFENYDIRDHITQNFVETSLSHLMYNHRFFTRLSLKHINVKEMTSILFVMKKWLNFIREKHLIIHDDNYVVVSRLRKRSIQDVVMTSLRDICMLLTKHDITIIFEWISTNDNTFANLLSRDKWVTIVNTWSQLLMTFSIDDMIKQTWVEQSLCFFDEN